MRLRIRGFVLGVFLVALVGWCIVHEVIVQTQARYLLADLARHEKTVKNRIEKLKAEEEALLRPDRLAKKNRELRLNYTALRTMPPAGIDRAGGAMAMADSGSAPGRAGAGRGATVSATRGR